MGGGHEKKQPVSTEGDDKLTWEEGRTGHGPVKGQLRSMYDGPASLVEEYPSNITSLEKNRWYNYLLNQELPPFITKNADENKRIWQDLEVERMLDHTPVHEIHPNELPDYHYWPMILNQVNPKPKTQTVGTERYHRDQSDLPRFFRTGIPKTPPHKQDWNVPLTNEGRFDWRKNIEKNGYQGGSYFSKRGWNQRYLVTTINQPALAYHVPGHRSLSQLPTYFRILEWPLWKRVTREYTGSTFYLPFFMYLLYGTCLFMGAKNDANWAKLNWVDEVYNFDMTFNQRARNMGGFHGVV